MPPVGIALMKMKLSNKLTLVAAAATFGAIVMVLSAPSFTPSLSLTERSLKRHDRIPLREDVLWRIERGVVRSVTWCEAGTVITLGYWGAGDVVGQRLSRLNLYEIECLTHVEVSLLPLELWQQAVEAIVSHTQQVELLLSIVNRNPLQQRLWQFLVFLEQKFGRDVEQGRLIDFPVTQQEMAEAINTTRVTVTRLLQQLELEGMLLRHSKRLILCR